MQSSQSGLERTAGQANSHSQGVQDHMMEQTHARIFFFLKKKRERVKNPFILQVGMALLAAIT